MVHLGSADPQGMSIKGVIGGTIDAARVPGSSLAQVHGLRMAVEGRGRGLVLGLLGLATVYWVGGPGLGAFWSELNAC